MSMPKKTTVLIAILSGVACVQGWLLYRTRTAGDETREPPIATVPAEHAGPAVAQHDVADALARIDARLSALEIAQSAAPAPAEKNIALGGPEALAADRKIAALLPNGPLTQEELFQFQTQLAHYPSSERAQLSAALARAINNGRVQIAATP